MSDSAVPQSRDSSALPRFDVNDADVHDHLYETMREVRMAGRVAYSERHGGYYMLTGYDDVRRAAMDHELFTTSHGVTIPAMKKSMPAIPLEVDPPEHTQYRRLLLTQFRPDQARALEPVMRATIGEAIDRIIEKGYADFYADIAEPVPPIIVAHVLGMETADWRKLRAWVSAGIHASIHGLESAEQESIDQIERYLRALLEHKRSDPGDDLISVLLAQTIEGEPLPDSRILGIASLVGIAGHETTVNAIANMLRYLGLHPDHRAALLDDPALIPHAVEEILRYDAPQIQLARTVTTDCVFAGHAFSAGDRVGLLWGSANHDERQFPDPESFRLDRQRNHHLTFGAGAHKCLGEHLARLEITVVVSEVLRRIPDYELVDPGNVEWTPGMNREMKSLPVTFPIGDRR
jgi:cytochrome P450